jgi:hypothetical protein
VPRSILPAAHGSPARTAYVEIRPIVYVYGWRRALVADIVTGRASVGEHQLHGNISRGAQFLPVIREPT